MDWTLSLGEIVGVPARVHGVFNSVITCMPCPSSFSCASTFTTQQDHITSSASSHTTTCQHPKTVLFPVALASVIVDARSSLAYLLWALLLYGPILLASVLIHELAHCLAARVTGSRVHSILLWPLGGLSYVGHSIGPKEDLFVALAGPLSHVVQAAFWLLVLLPFSWQLTGSVHLSHLLLYLPAPETHFWVALFAGAVELNMYLLLFNLFLPAYPLDGGRILVDALLLLGLPELPTALVTVVLGTLSGLGLCIWAFIATRLMAALVGGWVLFATMDLLRSIKANTVDEHPLFVFDVEPQMPLYFYEELGYGSSNR